MRFEETLKAVFEEKAEEMSPEHRRLLRAVWERGCEEGVARRAADFDQGRRAGLAELGVFFTSVLSRRPIERVFHLRSSTLEYQPWARAALQQVLDAGSLEEASRIASELGQLETSELMRRFGDAPSPELRELEDKMRRAAAAQPRDDEIKMLEGLWEREDDEDARRANEALKERGGRRR